MARPERYTADEVIAAIRKANTAAGAARILGCDPDTVRTYAGRYATVDKALKSERRTTLDYAEMALRAAVLKGEPWAVSLVVKTLGKEHYSERQEISGPDNEPLRVIVEYASRKVDATGAA